MTILQLIIFGIVAMTTIYVVGQYNSWLAYGLVAIVWFILYRDEKAAKQKLRDH